MKPLNSKLKFLLLILPLLFLGACNNDDDSTPPVVEDDIVGVIGSNEDLSILVEALERADLTDALSGEGPFTVFAPTNEAFTDLLTEAGFDSLEDVPVDVLTLILLNHVINADLNSSSLTTGYRRTLATGPDDENLSLFVDTTSGVKLNGTANVTTADVDATNGVVHILDAVIPVPNVVTHALANTDFSILVEALTRESFEGVYVNLLSGTEGSPFTVFAPTNAAFENLLKVLGASSLDDISDEVLQTVLNYHVIAEANVTSDELVDDQVVPTVGGETFVVDLTGGVPGIVDGTGFKRNIIAVNVQGSNGVIHAVSRVLLPPSVVEVVAPTLTLAGFVNLNPDTSSLAAAIDAADLYDALSSPDIDYTLFAPGNDAFDQFLEANGFTSLDDVPVDVLTDVLLNHVIDERLLAADITTGYDSTLATNSEGDLLSIYFNTESGVKINGGPEVTTADGELSNGVVHIVNQVIGLPTVVTFATADPTFEILVAALTREDLTTDFVDILSTVGESPSPFTVFAPTNQAFVDVLSELGLSSLGDVPAATLESVLFYHVVTDANVRAEDLENGLVVTTANGDPFTVNIAGSDVTITDFNDRVSDVVAVNVQAVNGVVHVINKVILPNLN